MPDAPDLVTLWSPLGTCLLVIGVAGHWLSCCDGVIGLCLLPIDLANAPHLFPGSPR